MRKAFVVAVREYQAAVRTKAFLVSLIAMPIMSLGGIVLQGVLKDKVDITDKHIAVVDYSHKLFAAIQNAANLRHQTEIFQEGEPGKQIKPRFLFEEVVPSSTDPEAVSLELSDRVRRKEIFAYVLIGPEVVDSAAPPERAYVLYHSNSPTYDDAQDWLKEPINARLHELRFAAVNIDPQIVQQATRSMPVENLGLVSVDPASGQIIKAEKTNEMANIFIPMGLMMLMFMVVMIGAAPLMQSVLEEKTNRIAEVLLGSLGPFELMLGKLLGMVGVSLTIVTVYLVGAYIAIHRAGYGTLFPAHMVWWFALFQCLAVIMYGSLFIAVGAAVNDMREAQSLVTPVMVVVVSPLLVWLNIVREPSSSFATASSLFPPVTPMLMVLRQAVPPGIPAWQPLVGAVLVVLTTLLFVFAAGRIFRVGILMQGKGPKLSEMIRWVVRG